MSETTERPVTRSVTAFAPASVANVTAGYDILGFAVDGVGDRVTVHRENHSGVRIRSVDGVVSDLPTEPAANTASVAVEALLSGHPLSHGLSLELDKGIPLGSGMGGSAASAVAAVVAANAFLPAPLDRLDLLQYAIAGERVASDASHGDNVAPSLLGGLTAVVGLDPAEVVHLPVPNRLEYVLVHPHLAIETRAARVALGTDLPIERHVRQSMHLAGFVAACFLDDPGLLARSMVDLVAEPLRAPLIPGFADAKAAAAREGALGFGIAGSGPSVFALVDSDRVATDVAAALLDVFAEQGIDAESWVGPIRAQGAEIVGVMGDT